MTKEGGLDREDKVSQDGALEDPYRKRKWIGGDRVIGNAEGAL